MSKVTYVDNYKELVPELSFEELSGFSYEKKILKTLYPLESMDSLLYIQNTKLFLFSGPEGYGKHTLTKALANYLAQFGYEYFVLDCEEIAGDEKCLQTLSGIFSDVFQYTSPDIDDFTEHRLFHILLDNFDAICEDRPCRKLLKKTFELLESEYSDYDCNCIISAITDDASKIPTGIRKCMYTFELEVPTEAERKEYFAKQFTFEMKNADGSVSEFVPVDLACPEAVLAKLTSGLSYADLKKVLLMAKLSYKRIAQEFDFELLRDTGIEEKLGFLTEEQLSLIVRRVKKGNMAGEVKKQDAVGVSYAPQVVYAAPPGMMTYNSAVGMGAAGSQETEDTEYVDLSLYESIPEEQDIEELLR